MAAMEVAAEHVPQTMKHVFHYCDSCFLASLIIMTIINEASDMDKATEYFDLTAGDGEQVFIIIHNFSINNISYQ